jgi:hypothetical protein
MFTGPTSAQPPPPPVAGAAGTDPTVPANAVLAMSGITVTNGGPADQPGTFYLTEKFTLTETGGRSGATILGIWSSVAGGDSFGSGPPCGQPIRVPRGGSTNAFDAGWDDLGYCAPFAVGRLPATVTIQVTFKDDDGRFGSVEATTVATK